VGDHDTYGKAVMRKAAGVAFSAWGEAVDGYPKKLLVLVPVHMSNV
jgi:hypothetical protein